MIYSWGYYGNKRVGIVSWRFVQYNYSSNGAKAAFLLISAGFWAKKTNLDARVKSVKHRRQSLFLSPLSRSGLGNWTFDAGINLL